MERRERKNAVISAGPPSSIWHWMMGPPPNGYHALI